ncbi:putative lysine decarboxylase [Caulifigura coniformis]|uniref:AMP nucleosidase n=1 Tax=Caulifigura coniformis TaxID=2527983 RepID=A0A517SIG2_9PLAN|nr:LOG family protein [Caulifigura coniformis]QDT55918.1 putative lysine decarboxylase [Caulifigura coniformis]
MNQSENQKTSHSETVLLSEESAVRDVLAQSMLGLWSVVNQLSRLKPTRRERYRVSIFGSARVESNHWVYGAVRDVSAELTRMGCDIVTGGGPGLMQAANEGARLADPEAKQDSVGIRIALPFEQDINAFVSDAYEHGTFFTRLHHFVLTSDAFVVVPGGIGTVLETMMIWQLLQVRKLHDTPLILVGKMWDGLIDWSRSAMLRPDFPLASPEDMEIPICVADGTDALEVLRKRHDQWRSQSTGS